ncbi:MAG: hypothetical protein AB8U53_07405 [Rickettsia aeschlimannii]
MKKDDGLFKDFVELGTVNTRYVKEPSQKKRTAILELLSAVPIDFKYLQKEIELPLPINIYGNIRIRTRRDSNASRR